MRGSYHKLAWSGHGGGVNVDLLVPPVRGSNKSPMRRVFEIA